MCEALRAPSCRQSPRRYQRHAHVLRPSSPKRQRYPIPASWGAQPSPRLPPVSAGASGTCTRTGA